jgi:hypothetical protein
MRQRSRLAAPASNCRVEAFLGRRIFVETMLALYHDGVLPPRSYTKMQQRSRAAFYTLIDGMAHWRVSSKKACAAALASASGFRPFSNAMYVSGS